jgi:Apea-like HEPN
MTHKLAERVAFFLGENGAERTSIFKNIKAAYTVRSKVVHGDKIDKKRANQAPDLSRTCDELLRKSLAKVLTNPGLPEIFLGPPGEREEYLTGMVLGVTNTTTT